MLNFAPNTKIMNLLNSRYFMYITLIILTFCNILFVLHKYTSYSILTSFLILGTLISLYIFPDKNRERIIKVQSKKSTYLLLSLFFIIYSFSVAYLWLFEPLYTKSLNYYFLIGICALLLFLITITAPRFISISLSPYILLLLSLNIFLSSFITFPHGLYASGDTRYQIFTFVLPIINNGTVPSGYLYSFFPIHQIYIASVSMITGFDPIKTYLWINSIIYGVATLFVYFFSANIFDRITGVIAALFFIASPNVVYHATHPYQFSYAFPVGLLLLFIILLLFSQISENVSSDRKKLGFSILLVFLIPVVIWTHQFTSFVIFILIIFILFFINLFYGAKYLSTFCTTTFFLYLCFIFFHWMYVSNVLSNLITVLNVYKSSLFSSENYQAAISYSVQYDTSPFWVILCNSVGTAFAFLLSVLGFFYGVSKKNFYVIVMASWGVLIWSLVSIGSYINMPLLLSMRLLTFFWSVCVIFLASLGIKFILRIFGSKGVIICSVLILLITTFNLASFSSGSETSPFVGNQINIKLYDTDSDLKSYSWIQANVPIASKIKTTEPSIPKYLDNDHIYGQLPFNNSDLVLSQIKPNDYLLLTSSISSGIRNFNTYETDAINLVTSNKMNTIEARNSYEKLGKIEYSKAVKTASLFNNIYSNGRCSIARL